MSYLGHNLDVLICSFPLLLSKLFLSLVSPVNSGRPMLSQGKLRVFLTLCQIITASKCMNGLSTEGKKITTDNII